MSYHFFELEVKELLHEKVFSWLEELLRFVPSSPILRGKKMSLAGAMFRRSDGEVYGDLPSATPVHQCHKKLPPGTQKVQNMTRKHLPCHVVTSIESLGKHTDSFEIPSMHVVGLARVSITATNSASARPKSGLPGRVVLGHPTYRLLAQKC